MKPSEKKELDKQTILIVDDETANVKILHEVLHNDYNVIFSTKGERAIELAIVKKPDLILLDIIMPEVDGYTVCKTLKNNPETRDISIIFITVKDNTSCEAKGFELGAVDYITKPINPSIVKARVRTHLSLIQARRELEEKNQELIKMASLREDIEAISRHDLKTPLNGIISLPQLIAEDGPLNNLQREYLQIIENSGYQMLNIVNMSLNLCKMERGTYAFSPKNVNLIDIVTKIKSELNEILNIKSLSIAVLIDNRKPYKFERFIVHGEDFLLYSMMANLIKNAVEASPENQAINIYLHHGQMDTITIQNMGTVPEDIRKDFFEKYSTYGKKSGMGLGTYSANMIAKIHSGTISLESDKTNDTRVIVRLPKNQANIFLQRAIRVLIVEDSSTEGLLIEEVLKKDPWVEVTGIANTGKDAIQMAKQLKPDIITMDIVLPDISGVEVTNEIMKNDPIPIVFVSAFSDEHSARMAFDAMTFGGLDVMAKPLRSVDWTDGVWGNDLLTKIKCLSQVNMDCKLGSHLKY
ncbi:MAG: response regulator receiver sensor signal transduction histidine kinase [Candidatus Magnetoglobus multicellularis str. Araruama]|uniref:histidine kinase n=1 Tax=Candidatus Magnetoglobus multicellularis str. Araruama TaxID=890399 RepID=A0A1V1PCW3_9BACT|nr:MAG: response regulator receiver sensor signal transduction histidine kinase [Candidatus Magnetoglobus multicellularis str. Araruama]